MTPRRRILVAAAVAGVVVTIFSAYHLLVARNPGPPPVTAVVTRGDIEQTVVASGTLEPQQLVSVGAQASGRLVSLKVALGDAVRAGDLIGQIDSQTEVNALKTAQAQLADLTAQRAAKQATLVQDELAFRRQQTMVAGQATSRSDYEAAEATLKIAKAAIAAVNAQIEVAEVSIDTARVSLGYTRVSAPMDGVVVSIVTKQGQTVNALQSAPTIVILAKLDVITVKAEISEADIIKLRPRQDVYFTILGDPDHRYYGTLRQIEPAPDSIVNEVNTTAATNVSTSSGTSSSAIYYNALFDVPNSDHRLRALMTAQVSVVLDAAKRALIVPSAALGPHGPDGRYTVWVSDSRGRALARSVRVGINNNVSAQILDGLHEGESVVVSGAGPAPVPPAALGQKSRMPLPPMGL